MDLLRGVAQEGDSEKTTCSDLNGGVGQSRNLPLNYIPIGNPEEEEGYSLPTVGENVNDPRPWSGFLSDPSMNYPLFSGGLYYQLPFPVVGFPLVSCSPPSSSPSSLMGSSSKDPTPRSPLQTKSPDQKAGKKRPYPFFDSVISDSKEAKRMHRDGVSSSTSASESNVNRKNEGSNETVARDFLSLSSPPPLPPLPPPPPAVRTSSTISSFGHPKPAASIQPTKLGRFIARRNQMAANREAREQTFVQGSNRQSQQPVCRYHNFFPPATQQRQSRTSHSNGSEESLDLELRLRPSEPSGR